MLLETGSEQTNFLIFFLLSMYYAGCLLQNSAFPQTPISSCIFTINYFNQKSILTNFPICSFVCVWVFPFRLLYSFTISYIFVSEPLICLRNFIFCTWILCYWFQIVIHILLPFISIDTAVVCKISSVFHYNF